MCTLLGCCLMVMRTYGYAGSAMEPATTPFEKCILLEARLLLNKEKGIKSDCSIWKYEKGAVNTIGIPSMSLK